MSDDLLLLKARLRRRARARRRALALATPDAAVAAASAFPEDLLRRLRLRLGRPPVVSGYRARDSEIDPSPLLTRLASLGARIALPVVLDRDLPLAFRAVGEAAADVPDAAGILGPPPEAEALTPDLLIVPLLAFDRSGGRLGQGGGYYDRTLWALRAAGGVIAVGLAYAGQEVPALDLASHDERLDAILTERGYTEV